MGSLNPALELWKSSVSIRKLPSGHTQSLQTRSIVREIAPDPLLSEWIDGPLRSHAVQFLKMSASNLLMLVQRN